MTLKITGKTINPKRPHSYNKLVVIPTPIPSSAVLTLALTQVFVAKSTRFSPALPAPFLDDGPHRRRRPRGRRPLPEPFRSGLPPTPYVDVAHLPRGQSAHLAGAPSRRGGDRWSSHVGVRARRRSPQCPLRRRDAA